MAKANPLISSFIGEIGPRLIGNVSFDKYPNAAETATNLISLTQGGFARRPGTRFIKEIKDSSSAAYLIPFEYSSEDSYIIEAGDNYFRFYRDQGSLVISDTDASITNGTFDSGITSWTDQSAGSGSISHDATNKQMLVTESSGNGHAEQSVAIGASYQSNVHALRFRVTGVQGDFIRLQIGTTSTGTELKDEFYGVGYHTVSFTPGAATIYVQFVNERAKSVGIDDVDFIDDSSVELVTPYTAAQVLSSARPQANDVMYIFLGGTTATHKLIRYGDNDWSLEEVEFTDGPYLDQNVDNVLPTSATVGLGQKRSQALGSTTILSVSANTGLGVTLTASSIEGINANTGFQSTDVGRLVRIQQDSTKDAGYGIITAVASTTSATMDVRRDFSSISETLAASPAVDHGSGLVGIPITGTAFSFYDTVTIASTTNYNGTFDIVSKTENEIVIEATYNAETFGGTETAVSAGTTKFWLGAFSKTTGYPSTGVFHDQRLWSGSTTFSPYSLMSSQTGDIENMRPDSFVSPTLTVEDDDALNFTLAATQSNHIKWVKSSGSLLAGTTGGEWEISPSTNGSVLTPTDIKAIQRSRIGSTGIQPIQADESVIFVQDGNRKVFDYTYSPDINGFRGRDLTVLSHRVSDSGITQMDYASEPDSSIYCVRTDGQIALNIYRPTEGKVSWTRLKAGGSFSTGNAVFESVATIQGEDGGGRTLDSSDRTEVWVIVKRTINSATKRYIEMFEGHFQGPIRSDYSTEALWESQLITEQKDAIYSDSALTYDSTATTTISGLDHLEGETVKVLADGGVHPDKTVSSGSISLDYEASKVQVGLGYSHEYKSVKLDYGGVAGTAVGKPKRINRITFVLLDTASFKFGKDLDNLRDVEFRDATDLMDTAVPLFSGDKRKDFSSGYDTDVRIHINSDTPLPFNLLAIAPELKTNDMR